MTISFLESLTHELEGLHQFLLQFPHEGLLPLREGGKESLVCSRTIFFDPILNHSLFEYFLYSGPVERGWSPEQFLMSVRGPRATSQESFGRVSLLSCEDVKGSLLLPETSRVTPLKNGVLSIGNHSFLQKTSESPIFAHVQIETWFPKNTLGSLDIQFLLRLSEKRK